MPYPFSPLLGLTLLSALLLTACGGSGSNDTSPSSSSSSLAHSSSAQNSSASTSQNRSSAPAMTLDFEHLYELANFPIGMAVSAGNEARSLLRSGSRAEAERGVIEQHFNQLTAGNIMKMSYLHDHWGNYTYTQANQLVDYVAAQGMTLHGHTLVWHSCYQVPNWVRTFTGDSESFLEALSTHVTTIASEYSGKVASWDVVNEAFLDNGQYRTGIANCWDDGEASLHYLRADGPTYIETAFMAARTGDPLADLYYNDFNLSPNSDKMAAVLTMVDDFQARDIPIDGIGFQMHIQMDWPSISAMSAAWQAVVERGLKVKLTELDIPINNPFSAGGPTYSGFTPAAAQAQQRRYCEVVAAYLNTVPDAQRGGITVWGLVDGESWLIDHFFNGNPAWPLLFHDDLSPKPALQGIADALRDRTCT